MKKGNSDVLLNFIVELGSVQPIEISHDNEPVLNAGVELNLHLRNKMGLRLVDQRSNKGRTATAERTIQTVRSQAKTILHDLEGRLQVKFGDKHIYIP